MQIMEEYNYPFIFDVDNELLDPEIPMIHNNILPDHEIYSSTISQPKPNNFSDIPNNNPNINITTHNPSFSSLAPSKFIISCEKQELIGPSDFKDQLNKTYEHGYDYNPGKGPQVLNFSSFSNDVDIYADEIKAENSIRNRSGPVRDELKAADHIVAERNRREKLNQLFIGLSKTVPGIQKLDKGSLLQHAVEYTKQLQERVMELEKQQAKLQDSAVINASSLTKDDVSFVSISDIDEESVANNNIVTEVKAKISNKSVLLNIWCKKRKDFMSKIHSEMEKLCLSVEDIRIMPLGDIALYATILAQMDNEFKGTEKDIVDHLKVAFFGALNPPEAHMQIK